MIYQLFPQELPCVCHRLRCKFSFCWIDVLQSVHSNKIRRTVLKFSKDRVGKVEHFQFGMIQRVTKRNYQLISTHPSIGTASEAVITNSSATKTSACSGQVKLLFKTENCRWNVMCSFLAKSCTDQFVEILTKFLSSVRCPPLMVGTRVMSTQSLTTSSITSCSSDDGVSDELSIL